MGLSAAFCAASSFIVIRKLKDRVDPLHIILYYHWVLVPLGIILGACIPSWMDSAKWIIPQNISTWALVLAATICGVCGQVFMTKALQTETAGKAASINNIQVIFAFTLEFLIWGAIPTALSLFGASIIVTSLACATIYKNKVH
jgi:drug/metabolite transporter (DMT)-like permease